MSFRKDSLKKLQLQGLAVLTTPRVRPTPPTASDGTTPVVYTARDIALHQRQVMDFLRQRNHIPASRDDILHELSIDVAVPELDRVLRKNPHLNVMEGIGKRMYSFKGKFDVRNSGEVLELCREQLAKPEQCDGIVLSELKDAYTGVEKDVMQLASERKVLLFQTTGARTKPSVTIYFNDEPPQVKEVLKFPSGELETVQKLWHEAEIKNPLDLEDKLRALGLKMTKVESAVKKSEKRHRRKKKKKDDSLPPLPPPN